MPATTTGERKGLVWPTVFMIVGVAVLASLGTWQWQRLVWKQGLIAQIEARTKAPPMSLGEAMRRARAGEDMEYARVRVEGRWRRDQERLAWAPEAGMPGWHIYTLLVPSTGPAVVVNRGFVADTDRDPARRPEPEAGEVVVTGLVRRPEKPGSFTPNNDVKGNKWYWRDLKGMVASMPAAAGKEVAPFFLDAEKGTAPPPAPQGGVTRLELPNSHLQYAVTWYGLALTLIGVYLAFVWQHLFGRTPRDNT